MNLYKNRCKVTKNRVKSKKKTIFLFIYGQSKFDKAHVTKKVRTFVPNYNS